MVTYFLSISFHFFVTIVLPFAFFHAFNIRSSLYFCSYELIKKKIYRMINRIEKIIIFQDKIINMIVYVENIGTCIASYPMHRKTHSI